MKFYFLINTAQSANDINNKRHEQRGFKFTTLYIKHCSKLMFMNHTDYVINIFIALTL